MLRAYLLGVVNFCGAGLAIALQLSLGQRRARRDVRYARPQFVGHRRWEEVPFVSRGKLENILM